MKSASPRRCHAFGDWRASADVTQLTMLLRAVAVGLLPLSLFLGLTGCVKARATTAPVDVVVGAVPDNHLDVATAGEREKSQPLWDAKDEVDVEWRGRWWPAIVLERRSPARYLVHYDGWNAEWDELVPPERIRVRTAEKANESNEPALPDADP